MKTPLDTPTDARITLSPATTTATITATTTSSPPSAIHPQVAATRMDDCELLLLADAGEALVLNAAGALLWQGIAGGEDAATLAARLTTHYPVPPATATADTLAFLAALAAAGAITLA